MTEVKHTPGPWKWNGDPLNGCDLMSLSGPVISYAAYENMWFSRYKKDEDLANAHLIAAAPDMEKALEQAQHIEAWCNSIEQCRMQNDHEDAAIYIAKVLKAKEDIQAALAKARGEEK